ncbi:MAG: hypothetical protein WAW11_00500 [Patescibacteria group bacterium]
MGKKKSEVKERVFRNADVIVDKKIITEFKHPVFKIMDVIINEKPTKVDFNKFEIKSKKVFRVWDINQRTMVNFSTIKPVNSGDQNYLNFIQKEYELMAVSQITAQKNAEKNLSKRRVA